MKIIGKDQYYKLIKEAIDKYYISENIIETDIFNVVIEKIRKIDPEVYSFARRHNTYILFYKNMLSNHKNYIEFKL